MSIYSVSPIFFMDITRFAPKPFIYVHVCYRQYVDDLRAYRDECNSVLSEVTQALSFLTELQSKYLNVSRKTNALHEACENLLEEQVSDTKEGIFPFFDGAV